MAKVKFSALVSEMRNKLNGSVFSKNRAGNYLRNKVTPVNPQTIAQVAARNRLSSWSQAFRGLTAAQIASWNSAVEQFKTTDIFGDMKTPSGINLFTRLNINLDLVGGTNITTPPLPVTLGQIEGLALVSDVSSSTVTLTWTSGAVPANTAWLIEATPCISAGKSFVKSEAKPNKLQPVDLLADLERAITPIQNQPEKLPVQVVEVKQPEQQETFEQELQNINTIPGVAFEKAPVVDPFDTIFNKINELATQIENLQCKVATLENKPNVGQRLAQARAAKRASKTMVGAANGG